MDRRYGVPLFWCLAAAALALTHLPFLSLPFYWDELGQFVPAALDIYHRMAWVPYSTVPNVHPPGVMAWLAAFWGVFGFSVVRTRIAMLLIAAGALVAAWELALELTARKTSAWFAALLLFVSPLFFSQAILAQLDMPAMLLTTAALVLYLRRRYGMCAAACCLAVMVKETAIVAPALFGFLLLRRRQTREALLFVLPLAPLLLWLFTLKRQTGHFLGSPNFTDYNLFYPLHPVRLGFALLRRGYYLAIGSGHIIGTIVLLAVLRKARWSVSDKWKVAGAFAALHTLLISVLGGAVLERYLLPALPVLYAAFAWAIGQLPQKPRRLTALALVACLAIACVRNPPYPFPMENNLAWTTFVTLGRDAAQYVQAAIPNARIATSFPMAGALRRPEMGYVSRAFQVVEINDFRAQNLESLDNRADALIEYSVIWDPLGILRIPALTSLLERYYGYVPQTAPEDVPGLTGMRRSFRTCAAGQCIDVFEKPVTRRPIESGGR